MKFMQQSHYFHYFCTKNKQKLISCRVMTTETTTYFSYVIIIIIIISKTGLD